MPSFNDAEGRTWNLSLTIGRLREIRATSGVDLGDVGGGGFLQIAVDIEKFIQVLWILVEKQAVAKTVSPEDFAEALDGDVLDQASKAFTEAVVRFTHAANRPAWEKAISMTTTAYQEATVAMVERVDMESVKQNAISGALSQSSLAS